MPHACRHATARSPISSDAYLPTGDGLKFGARHARHTLKSENLALGAEADLHIFVGLVSINGQEYIYGAELEKQ